MATSGRKGLSRLEVLYLVAGERDIKAQTCLKNKEPRRTYLNPTKQSCNSLKYRLQ